MTHGAHAPLHAHVVQRPRAFPSKMSEKVYKIVRSAEHAQMQAEGRLRYAGVDEQDGFVHMSRGAQVAATLERYFGGCRDVVLLVIPLDGLDAEKVKWELAPTRGEEFPHYYAHLEPRHVAAIIKPECDADGKHILPELD